MTDKQIIIDGVDVSECENLMQGIVLFGCMEDRKTCSCMNNPNCLYKQLKRKEQECEELQNKFLELNGKAYSNSLELDQLKEKNEKTSKGYAELTEIVSPYIDDFTGYNEKLGGFDIVLCVKELLQQFKEESKELHYQLRCSTAREQEWKRNCEFWDNRCEELQQQLDQLKAEKEQAEQKLEKIEAKCRETLELMNKDSGTSAYAGGRCIEAGQVLSTINPEKVHND